MSILNTYNKLYSNQDRVPGVVDDHRPALARADHHRVPDAALAREAVRGEGVEGEEGEVDPVEARLDAVALQFARQEPAALHPRLQVLARGEIPFLHVFSNNESAIALYKRQGMEIRRRLHVTVLRKA